MIVVSDNQGDRVEVGETRADLEQYLSDTCSDDYAEQVLAWYDGGSREFQLDNGWEDVVDTWTNFAIDEDDDEEEDYEDYDDGYGEVDEDEEASADVTVAA